ncbi:hypothetical protein F5I97DRAFT_574774 [Phlebopus sp. FC_14]|nr:hypothetical protein F5I97DRAFT_574774 [Phlebopus sp. FC_14]
MSDKQKAIVALTFVSQTCTAALSALSVVPRSEDGASDHETTDLSVILKDLDSLLALIYNLSTKLSLSLKPSSPSYSASLPLLQDIAEHTSAVVHCTDLLRVKLHGATLVKDTAYLSRGIIESMRAVVQTFLDNATSSDVAGEEYLVRTGTLHELITRARAPSGIPKDNQTAVRHHWKSNQDALDDNLQEVDRMIEEAENDDAGNDVEDEFNDGWDELGIEHSRKMEEDELARTKNVRQILRLTTLLHKRILLNILSSSSGPVSNTASDSLLVQSDLLSATSDDLATTLYTPQDPNSVLVECINLTKVARSIRDELQMFFPAPATLDDHLGKLVIEDNPTDLTIAKTRKKDELWFHNCFEQILKVSGTLQESLHVASGRT